MDRRQLLSALAGLAAAGATGIKLVPARVLAQDIRQDELVSVSTGSADVAARTSTRSCTQASVRWPTHWGSTSPSLVFNVINGETVPWLATRWEFSADAKTLTFTIREGVKWSDGTPFTAKDVAIHLPSDERANGAAGWRRRRSRRARRVRDQD